MMQMDAGLTNVDEPRARHFIVPLPAWVNPKRPISSGSGRYEFRIGHKTAWSTAQARFGRPLVVRGVQHPPPALRCSVARIRPGPSSIISPALPPQIVVTAPHATAVFEDKRLTNPQAGDPRTQIWVLLYAQVRQVDRKRMAQRSDLAPARFAEGCPNEKGTLGPPASRDIVGVAEFEEAKVAAELADLALPENVGLSVIAVELVPGGPPQALVNPTLMAAVAGFQGSAGLAQQGGDPLGRELGSIASRRDSSLLASNSSGAGLLTGGL